VQTKPLALLPIAIPFSFVQDVTGFMVGSKSEQGGIINGAKWLMQ
jgi:acetyl-CoA carboxylase carboxyltransferase component